MEIFITIGVSIIYSIGVLIIYSMLLSRVLFLKRDVRSRNNIIYALMKEDFELDTIDKEVLTQKQRWTVKEIMKIVKAEREE